MIVNRGSSGGGGAPAASLPDGTTVTISDTVTTLASGWSF